MFLLEICIFRENPLGNGSEGERMCFLSEKAISEVLIYQTDP